MSRTLRATLPLRLKTRAQAEEDRLLFSLSMIGPVVGAMVLLRGYGANLADTGPSIPEAGRERVFKLFYSVDPHQAKGGNGLVLALVKAIAERLNGRITLSDRKPGPRVDITFPSPSGKKGRLANR